jgi:predicted O-methyltransferase YrrM
MRATVARWDRYRFRAAIARVGGRLWWSASLPAAPARRGAGVAWRFLRHVAVDTDDGCIRRALGAGAPATPGIGRLLDELRCSPALTAALDTPEARRWLQAPATRPAWDLLQERLALEGTGRGRALFWYVAVRLLRPGAVVETGCFSGWDTAVILQALAHNGHGHLYSIDRPLQPGQRDPSLPGGGLPQGLAPGFLVPPVFYRRWTLILGDARDELPPLLRRLGTVDMFFHDSDHRYAHMMWEYTTVWPHLAAGGLLVSDDISLHTALWDFATGVGAPVIIHRSNPNVGAVPVRRRTAR